MNKSIQNLIFATLLLIVTGAGFGFGLWWVGSQGELLHNQANEVALQQAREASHTNLRRIAEETADDRTQLQQYFFVREGESADASIDALPDFLTALEDYATQSGVVFETNAIDSEVNAEDDTEWLEIKSRVSGAKEQVNSFIRVVENLPYVLRISSIDFGARSSQVWEAELTIRVRVLAYGE